MKLRDKLQDVIDNGGRFSFGATEFYRLTTEPETFQDSAGLWHTADGVDAVRYRVPSASTSGYVDASLLPTWQSNRFDVRALVEAIWYNRRYLRMGHKRFFQELQAKT